MDDNLYSLKKLQNDINSMTLLSCFFNSDQKENLKHLKKQLQHFTTQIELFNKYFSDYGWCAYDSINFKLLESANKAYELSGIETGEKVLLEYYKTDVRDIIHCLKARSNAFMARYNLIQTAFEDHFAGRYNASIPLFLIIIDGAVNDHTQSKGFFAEGTDVSVWDCLVGCSDGLIKLKDIFNKGRNKTNRDQIRLPYRNGILHGRDLNYGNEYVSCKCVALMFALADWMSMKDTEEERKSKFEEEQQPTSLSDSVRDLKQNEIDKEEIGKWKRRTIIIGQTIKPSGDVTDYFDFPYVIPLLNVFLAWKNKNYGKLSILLKNLFPNEKSDKKRAGECRQLFQSKNLIAYELKEIEERACSLTRILVQVDWCVGEKVFSETLEFGCIYQTENGTLALPWRNQGEWIIMPWDVQALYKI